MQARSTRGSRFDGKLKVGGHSVETAFYTRESVKEEDGKRRRLYIYTYSIRRRNVKEPAGLFNE